MKKALVVLGCGALLVLGAGLGFSIWMIRDIGASGNPSYEEVSRVLSPSRRVEAIVVRSNGGATNDFGDQVYLVPSGRTYAGHAEVARFYGARPGVNPVWNGPRTLVLEYRSAKDARLTNAHPTMAGQPISIVLRSGADSLNPPSGRTRRSSHRTTPSTSL